MKNKLIHLIKNNPVKIAHLVGFTDMTELHNEWLKDMIFGEEDETLLAHRGSYKSTALSLAFAIIMVFFPYRNIIFLRKTDNDVIEIVKQTANILKTPLFNYISNVIWGCDLIIESESAFKITTNLSNNTKGAEQLLGIGVNGSLTGKHAFYIFTDDIVNLKDRISRAEREHTKLVYMELQNVKNRGGRIFNTGTKWHKEDAIELMPNVKIYDCYSTGLITKEQLQKIRDSMTPSLFSANYELKHIADADALFSNAKFFSDIKLLYNGVTHIDASYGGADGTAITFIKQVGERFYVLGQRRNKHVDDCLDELYITHAKVRSGTIHMEKNGDKGYLQKEIKADGLPTKGYNENMNKFVKITTYLKANWKNIYFHEDTDPDYLNEILDYTEHCEHDDSPDSLASIIRNLTGKGKWIY